VAPIDGQDVATGLGVTDGGSVDRHRRRWAGPPGHLVGCVLQGPEREDAAGDSPTGISVRTEPNGPSCTGNWPGPTTGWRGERRKCGPSVRMPTIRAACWCGRMP